MAEDEGVGYRLIGNTVYLRGKAQAIGPERLVFTLPEGFRPLAKVHFQVASGAEHGGVSLLTLTPDGLLLAAPADGWISLDGINFPVD